MKIEIKNQQVIIDGQNVSRFVTQATVTQFPDKIPRVTLEIDPSELKVEGVKWEGNIRYPAAARAEIFPIDPQNVCEIVEGEVVDESGRVVGVQG